MYDTEQAQFVWGWPSDSFDADGSSLELFEQAETMLFQKRDGEFFLYQVGDVEEYTRNSNREVEDGSDDEIIPLSYERAEQWCDKHVLPEDRDKVTVFDDEGSGNVIPITVRITPAAKRHLNEMACGRTQGSVVDEAMAPL